MSPTLTPTRAPAPSLAIDAFAEALDLGDLAALADCFCRESCLITNDGTAVHGRHEIGALLAQLLDRHARVELGQIAISRVGALALATALWTMHSDGPGGTAFSQAAEPTLVLREVEGIWKIAILALWGVRHPRRVAPL